jgi:hypothetical protein
MIHLSVQLDLDHFSVRSQSSCFQVQNSEEPVSTLSNLPLTPKCLLVMSTYPGYFENQKFQTVEMLECNVDPLMQNPIRYCHNLQHPKFRAQKESLGNLVSKTLHVILLTTISDDQTPMSKL